MDRIKYASQADPDLLEAMRRIARDEGRQFQAVMEDAMREYLDRRRGEEPRDEVRRIVQEDMERYAWLARKLAE